MAVLVGKEAPGFSAAAVTNGGTIVEDFTLEQFRGKYVVLFFYPKDFTFVCPTELHAFQERLEDFKARNVEVVAVSTDTEQSHWGWLQMEKKDGGIKGITYPIVADTNKTISYNYDVLAGNWYWDDNEQMQQVCTEAENQLKRVEKFIQTRTATLNETKANFAYIYEKI